MSQGLEPFAKSLIYLEYSNRAHYKEAVAEFNRALKFFWPSLKVAPAAALFHLQQWRACLFFGNALNSNSWFRSIISSPSPPLREERAGERRFFGGWLPPLSGSLPARSSQGERDRLIVRWFQQVVHARRGV